MNFIRSYKYPLGITLSLISLFFIFQNGTCANQATVNTQGAYQSTSNTGNNTSTLTLTGSAPGVAPGTSMTFTASGGTPPYYYTSVTGGGTFTSPATGTFVAPNYNSTCVVQVQDSANSTPATATLIVSSSITGTQTGLTLSPIAPTVGLNASVQFTAAGGTPPYTFTANGSLGHFSTSSSGLFTAGSQSGTMQIQVTDSAGASQVTNVAVSNSGTLGTNYKFVSATASSNLGGTWDVSHLIDGNASTCYSSTQYSSAGSSGAYVRLILGDATTGATGSFYKMDHLNLTARMSNGHSLAFPLSYAIQYVDSDSTWQTLGTFNTQPGSDGIAYLYFTPIYTSEISIIATYLTVDDQSHYYFQLCEVTH